MNGPALDSRRFVTVQGLTVTAAEGKLLGVWPAGSGKVGVNSNLNRHKLYIYVSLKMNSKTVTVH